MFVFIKKWS